MTKNALFVYFWARISEKLLSYLKSAPSNLSKNESLTHAVNFGVASAFSKGQGSALSEGPVLGLHALYKVPRKIVTEFNNLQISSFPISFFYENVNVGNSIIIVFFLQ